MLSLLDLAFVSFLSSTKVFPGDQKGMNILYARPALSSAPLIFCLLVGLCLFFDAFMTGSSPSVLDREGLHWGKNVHRAFS